jgi:hypothetical protein
VTGVIVDCGTDHPLQVVHAQWIYRCILVLDRNTGTLISAHKENSLKEIEHQLTLGLDGLMEEDKFLLKCNFDNFLQQKANIRSIGFSPYRRHRRSANYVRWRTGRNGCIPLEPHRKRAQLKLQYITANAYAHLHLGKLNIFQVI